MYNSDEFSSVANEPNAKNTDNALTCAQPDISALPEFLSTPEVASHQSSQNILNPVKCTACNTIVHNWDIHTCDKFTNSKQRELTRCASGSNCMIQALVPVNGGHTCGVCDRPMHTICGDGTEGAISTCFNCSQSKDVQNEPKTPLQSTLPCVGQHGANDEKVVKHYTYRELFGDSSSVESNSDDQRCNIGRGNTFAKSKENAEFKEPNNESRKVPKKGKKIVRKGIGTGDPSIQKPSASAAAASRRSALKGLLNHKVAYTYQQPETWMKSKKKIYEAIGPAWLIGTVKAKKGQTYTLIWDQTVIKDAPIVGLESIRRGIKNYQRLIADMGLVANANLSWCGLTKTSNEVRLTENVNALQEVPGEFCWPSENFANVQEVEDMMNASFMPNAKLKPPKNLFVHEDNIRDPLLDLPKEEYADLFEHSAVSSFFAYLPLVFWNKVRHETNLYLQNKNRNVAGCRNVKDFTLDEIMTYLGILFFMKIVVKGEYRNYWGNQFESELHNYLNDNDDTVKLGLESVMTLKRFEQIQASWSYRAEVSTEDLSTDPLARVRPLIRVFNQNCARYIVPGRNLAIDESSIACRSKFGRGLIMFNPTKPGGKYHFRLYVMTTGHMFIILNTIVHSRCTLEEDLIQNTDLESTREFIVEVKDCSALRKLMLTLLRPMHNSNRILNTDNLYTDIRGMIQLQMKGLYSRGTIRKNRMHIPKQLLFSKQEVRDANRGDFRFASELDRKIVCVSWIDGNEVHAMSNADGTAIDLIERQVGNERKQFSTLRLIKSYNKYMQGVDRADQYRTNYSIADGHSVNKWHEKMGRAFIDFARVNAFQTRKLFCSREGSKVRLSKRNPHRQFVCDLAKELMSGDWKHVPLHDPSMRHLLYQDVAITHVPDLSFFSPPPCGKSYANSVTSNIPSSVKSPTRALFQCDSVLSSQVFPTESKKRKRLCKVCKWENRASTVTTDYCPTHFVSLCRRLYPVNVESEPKPYCCPDHTMNCWNKFHQYYLPKGLYTAKGTIHKKHKLNELRHKDPDAKPLRA